MCSDSFLSPKHSKKQEFSENLIEFEKICEGLMSTQKAGFGIASQFNFTQIELGIDASSEESVEFKEEYLELGEENISDSELEEGVKTNIDLILERHFKGTNPSPLKISNLRKSKVDDET